MEESTATRDALMERFEERKEKNKDVERVDSGRLPAGAPMFYYCRACGAERSLPESHNEPSATLRHCGLCRRLIELGLIDE